MRLWSVLLGAFNLAISDVLCRQDHIIVIDRLRLPWLSRALLLSHSHPIWHYPDNATFDRALTAGNAAPTPTSLPAGVDRDADCMQAAPGVFPSTFYVLSSLDADKAVNWLSASRFTHSIRRLCHWTSHSILITWVVAGYGAQHYVILVSIERVRIHRYLLLDRHDLLSELLL